MPKIEVTLEQLELLRNLVREEYQFWDGSDPHNRMGALDELSEALSGKQKWRVTVVEDWSRSREVEVWAETKASAESIARSQMVQKTPGLEELGMSFSGFEVVDSEKL